MERTLTLGSFAMVVVALAVLLTALYFRRVRWSDSRGRGVIIPQYVVPSDLNLLNAGDLVGLSENALSAQLVSFVVRGHTRIVDRVETGGAGIARPYRYVLELLHSDGLDAQELRIIDILFGVAARPGAKRPVTGHGSPLSRQLNLQLVAANLEVVKRGWRSRASQLEQLIPQTAGVLVGFVSFSQFAFAMNFPWSAPTAVPLIVAFGIGVATIRASSTELVLSASGVERRDFLLGIRDYLQLAEADRFRMLQSPSGADRVQVDANDPRELVRLDEKLLPFAVLFGIEHHWTGELAELTSRTGGEVPDWYASTGGFNPGEPSPGR